ncbi:hypothetical protein EV182_003762 [Spiromyces aspiralis]|uniref:Uncharacterized protein n=1 Tax=Spiromyces aspiralis TaxID=68401 RepID=A0ACC1HTL1_9FUNG|nr:hypothetical protein EV182_003762 [Spiromyces aspiralis]
MRKIYKDRLTDPREEEFDELAEALEKKFDLEPHTFAWNPPTRHQSASLASSRALQPYPATRRDKRARVCDTECGNEKQQKQRQTPLQGEVPKGPTTRSMAKQCQAEQQRRAKGKRRA